MNMQQFIHSIMVDIYSLLQVQIVLLMNIVLCDLGHISVEGEISGLLSMLQLSFDKHWQFSKVVLPIYTLPSSVWDLQLFHTLAKIWCYNFFSFL